MKLVRREFLYLAGATAAFPADISIVLAQAQAARPTLTQILRGDLEGQGQKVPETLVSTVEWGPRGEAPLGICIPAHRNCFTCTMDVSSWRSRDAPRRS
jgi:hypothetical protein